MYVDHSEDNDDDDDNDDHFLNCEDDDDDDSRARCEHSPRVGGAGTDSGEEEVRGYGAKDRLSPSPQGLSLIHI